MLTRRALVRSGLTRGVLLLAPPLARAAILKLGAKLEALGLGAYHGAVENVQTPQLRLPIGQIAANEAQHASALARAAGSRFVGRAFAPALQIDAVSAALDTYEA